MPLQVVEAVAPGQVIVSKNRTMVLTVESLSTSIAIVVFDTRQKVGGIAYVVMPDSSLDYDMDWKEQSPAKYADYALPYLWEVFRNQGGQSESSWVKVVGGAQLFHFSGGVGNALNLAARNLLAVRTGLSNLGVPVEKTDTGGNKVKTLRFVLAMGQLTARRLGEKEDYNL